MATDPGDLVLDPTCGSGTTATHGSGPHAMAKAIPLDPDSITHGIQLAVAPVFLLTAVSGMIGAVAGLHGIHTAATRQ